MSDQSRGLHILRKLKAMGISVSMDDFGTGYSSLATLHAFPFDKIKLDQSFVKRLPEDAAAAAIVRTVLALGESLGMPVLAEGIETEAQWQFLDRRRLRQGPGLSVRKAREPCATARPRSRPRRASFATKPPAAATSSARQRRSQRDTRACAPRYSSANLSECEEHVTLLAVSGVDFLNTTGERGWRTNKKKRGGADRRTDRVERALRGRLLVEEIQDHAGED